MDDANPRWRRIAVSVKAWLEKAGMNPTDLHKQTGLGRNTLYAILDAKREPTIEVLSRIAQEVGATPGQLVDGILPGPERIRPVIADELEAEYADRGRRLRAVEEEVAVLRAMRQDAVDAMPRIEALEERVNLLTALFDAAAQAQVDVADQEAAAREQLPGSSDTSDNGG